MGVLITGSSGAIGARLAPRLAEDREVVCLSRRDPGLGLPTVLGDRAEAIDLSAYERAGHTHDGLYAMDAMRATFGFVSAVPVCPSALAPWQQQHTKKEQHT